jgi:hypothetical protein
MKNKVFIVSLFFSVLCDNVSFGTLTISNLVKIIIKILMRIGISSDNKLTRIFNHYSLLNNDL